MTYWFYRTMAILPLSLKYAIAGVFVFFVQHIIRYRRSTVDSNLAKAFPDESLRWRQNIRSKFYRQFVDTAMETFHGWRISESELRERMTLSGWEALAMESSGELPPGIILTAHHANWEWLMQRASLEVAAPLDAVYKPLHDRGADRFALETRGRWGGTLVTMKAAPRHVLKHRRHPRVLALLADQSPGKRESVHWTTFMNQPTGFFMGPATLAKLTGHPVYFARSFRTQQGRYHVTLELLFDDPANITEADIVERYVRCVEETIKAQPESYLWSNRRWKRSPPDTAN